LTQFPCGYWPEASVSLSVGLSWQLLFHSPKRKRERKKILNIKALFSNLMSYMTGHPFVALTNLFRKDHTGMRILEGKVHSCGFLEADSYQQLQILKYIKI
jgi:hypothetical protein